MAININKRVFGGDIDPIIKRKLAARQHLAARTPLDGRTHKFSTDSMPMLDSYGIDPNQVPMRNYSPSGIVNGPELSVRKPIARMWVAMDVIHWQCNGTTMTTAEKEEKENREFDFDNPTVVWMEDRKEPGKWWEYEPDSTMKRVYVVGNNQYSRTDAVSITDGQYNNAKSNPSIKAAQQEQPAASGPQLDEFGNPQPGPGTILHPDLKRWVMTSEFPELAEEPEPLDIASFDDLFPPELLNNTFLSDLANIKNVTSETQGSLGLIKKTKVDFVVNNWNDFDKIFFKYFMQPGAKVWVDYGWDSGELYPPECMAGFDESTCKEPFSEGGYTTQRKLYDYRHGYISVTDGDLVAIEGTVTGWNAEFQPDATIVCSVELTSANNALMGSDFDDYHSLFRDMIIQDLEEMFLLKAFSMFLPPSNIGYDSTLVERHMEEVEKGDNNLMGVMAKMTKFAATDNAYGMAKTVEDVNIWDEIGSNLFRVAQKFLSVNPAAGFGGDITKAKTPASAIYPILTGVYYHLGNDKEGYSASNIYVTWGRFEDDILNRNYSFGSRFDTKRGLRPTEGIEWNSCDSYTKYSELLVKRQLSEHNAEKKVFLIPSAWGHIPAGNNGDGYWSWNAQHKRHPGYDPDLDTGPDAYDDEVPDVDWAAYKGVLPGKKAQDYRRDIGGSYKQDDGTTGPKFNRIPLREVFIRLDVIKDALQESNNMKQVVMQILDQINDSSADLWHWQMGSNTDDGKTLSIIDTNFNPIVDPDRDSQGDMFKKMFIFQPYSPNTIVKNFNFSLETPSDEISSMLAIQGSTNVGQQLSLNKVTDRQKWSQIDWEAEYAAGFKSGVEDYFMQIRYNPNPATNFPLADMIKQRTAFLKNLNENRTAMLTEGRGSQNTIQSDPGIEMTKSHFDWYFDPTASVKKDKEGKLEGGTAVADTIARIKGIELSNSERKSIVDDRSDEDKENMVNGPWNWYTEKISRFNLQKYSSTPLPAKCSLGIYGIGGISPGNTFRVDCLPSKYREGCYFQIMKVKDEVKPETWTTNFETQFRVRPYAKIKEKPTDKPLWISKKHFNSLKNFKKLKPHVHEFQPVVYDGDAGSVQYATNIFTFKCKTKFSERVEDHMPKMPTVKDLRDTEIKAMMTNLLFDGNYKQMQIDGAYGYYVDNYGGAGEKAEALAKKLQSDKRKNPSNYKDGALPSEHVKAFKDIEFTRIEHMVENGGKYQVKRIEGRESILKFKSLPKLPNDDGWRDNWPDEKKFYSRFVLEKGKQYFLVVRKPYWYIFDQLDAENIKAWEGHFGTLYGVMYNNWRDERFRTLDLSKFPNLSALAIDNLQGRHYLDMKWDYNQVDPRVPSSQPTSGKSGGASEWVEKATESAPPPKNKKKDSKDNSKVNYKSYKAMADAGWTPCFDGFGKVSMADGSLKLVKDIVLGDEVKTENGTAKISKIHKDSSFGFQNHFIGGEYKFYEHNGLQLTSHHWVNMNNKWVNPVDSSDFELVNAKDEFMYNFEIDSNDINKEIYIEYLEENAIPESWTLKDNIYINDLLVSTTSEFQLQISSFINNIRDRVQDEYGLHRGTTPESEINKVLNSNKHKIRNDIDNLIESLNLNVMENV